MRDTPSTTRPAACTTALAFAARGHAVFPLWGVNGHGCACGNPSCQNIAKHPFWRLAKKGHRDATTKQAKIVSWWSDVPDLNVGIRTDKILVIDVDPRHGGDDTWRALELRHGEVPHTWRAITGGGGEHIMFEMPAPGIGNSAGKLGPGVDVRGVGGYIVGPGSMHASGRPYAWSVDHHPSETPLAPAPEWIIAELAEVRTNGEPRPPEYYNDLVAPAPDGERHDRLTKLIGHLLGAVYPDRVVLLSLVLAWNRMNVTPALSDDEVIGMFKNIHVRETKKWGPGNG